MGANTRIGWADHTFNPWWGCTKVSPACDFCYAAGLDDRHVPLTDVRVTLVDGKAHSVDSSDAAFQMAGALAVRDAAAQAGLALLEPLARIEVSVPDAYVGAVMSDLSGRRGRVSGSSTDASAPVGLERTVVSAEVPEMELLRYSATLRGISGWRGISGPCCPPPAPSGAGRGCCSALWSPSA